MAFYSDRQQETKETKISKPFLTLTFISTNHAKVTAGRSSVLPAVPFPDSVAKPKG